MTSNFLKSTSNWSKDMIKGTLPIQSAKWFLNEFNAQEIFTNDNSFMGNATDFFLSSNK